MVYNRFLNLVVSFLFFFSFSSSLCLSIASDSACSLLCFSVFLPGENYSIFRFPSRWKLIHLLACFSSGAPIYAMNRSRYSVSAEEDSGGFHLMAAITTFVLLYRLGFHGLLRFSKQIV